jgi:hypothetical protein
MQEYKMFTRDTKAKKIPMYHPSFPRKTSGQRIVRMTALAAMFAIAVGVVAAHADAASSSSDLPLIFAQQSGKSGSGEQRDRPPREALEACSGAKKNAACSFAGRDGELLNGKCGAPEAGVPLACMPKTMPGKG